MKEITAAELRAMNDTDCSNVVISRQIRRFIKKVQSFKEIPITCYIHGAKFTSFKFSNDKFIWAGRTYGKNQHDITVTSEDESLNSDELNKLIITTFQTMCDMNSSEDLSDTPEDLLAYAESKLKEFLMDEVSNPAEAKSN